HNPWSCKSQRRCQGNLAVTAIQAKDTPEVQISSNSAFREILEATIKGGCCKDRISWSLVLSIFRGVAPQPKTTHSPTRYSNCGRPVPIYPTNSLPLGSPSHNLLR